MLKLFEVTGFRGFQKTISLDFSDVREYQFNDTCITNGLISSMIIYGKNAIGKTNFGLALFDINPRYSIVPDEEYYDPSYLNTHTSENYAEFRYVFRFEDQKVEYVYRKNAPNHLIYEKIVLDDKLLFEYDRENPERVDTKGITELSPTLILDFENVTSIFNYVIANVPLKPEHPLRRTRDYIENMQLRRSSNQDRFRINASTIDWQKEFSARELQEFEDLLRKTGISDRLVILENKDGRGGLYFDTQPPLPFFRVASTGTRALLNFYLAYRRAKRGLVSLLFLDEFDSFYHFELAEDLVKMLECMKNIQVIFTSHNTKLLNNRIMRPDCYFILTQDKLTSFANATKRELREGHNLEKLFTSGEFGG